MTVTPSDGLHRRQLKLLGPYAGVSLAGQHEAEAAFSFVARHLKTLESPLRVPNQGESDLPWLRKHVGIGNRRLVVDRGRVDERVAFDDVQRIAVKGPDDVEPRPVGGLVTSTTSVLPSQRPRESPIQSVMAPPTCGPPSIGMMR